MLHFCVYIQYGTPRDIVVSKLAMSFSCNSTKFDIELKHKKEIAHGNGKLSLIEYILTRGYSRRYNYYILPEKICQLKKTYTFLYSPTGMVYIKYCRIKS